MLYRWLKIVFGVLFGLSGLVLMSCYSLAFAGGWVGKYASIIEIAGFISFFASQVFGLVCLWLFWDVILVRIGLKK